MLDALPVAVVVVDDARRITYINPAGQILRGDGRAIATLEELDRELPLFATDGRRQAIEDRPLNRALAHGERISETIRYRRLDGEEGILEVTATPLPGPGAVATYLDVTERVRMEADLAERAAQFKALLDYLPVGVAYFDDQGFCRASNGPARRTLGRSREEITGTACDRLFDRAPDLCEALRRCLRDRAPHAEQSSPWPDPAGDADDPRFLDWRFEPLPPDPDRSTGALALIVDVTDRKRAEDDLKVARDVAEQSARNKTQFLSAVSHDLRTPVNALSLQAELLVHEVDQSDHPQGELRDLVHDLRQSAANLIELINDLLDLARFDSGDVEHRPSDFRVSTWLDSVLGPLLLTARTKGLDLTWGSDRPDRVVHADRVKLGRVLTNLVGNAIKFTDSGSVTVRAGMTPDGWLSLSVADTGPGIPDDQRERIFDEFAQLRNPERDRTKGTGLGLSICKRLVEAAGGRLMLSTHLGLGSTFTALYPPDHIVQAPSDQPDRETTPKAPPTARDAILLIEDDERSRRALTRLLERVGYAVEAEPDGPRALEHLGRGRLALVLLDLILPGMDGLEVLRRIRAEEAGRDLPVVLLSGDVLGRQADEFAALGATEVLTKPVDFDALLLVIERFIGPRRESS